MQRLAVSMDMLFEVGSICLLRMRRYTADVRGNACLNTVMDLVCCFTLGESVNQSVRQSRPSKQSTILL